jgi:5-methylcytosine-specific restriction endonuclease McrA
VPTRLCIEPRCPEPALPRRSKCQRHYREYEAARPARRRAATKGIFKTTRWAMTRRAVLARDPICKACDQALSTQADHIVPLEDGGDPYRLEGLQGLCDPCHWAKTGAENARRGRGKVAA